MRKKNTNKNGKKNIISNENPKLSKLSKVDIYVNKVFTIYNDIEQTLDPNIILNEYKKLFTIQDDEEYNKMDIHIFIQLYIFFPYTIRRLFLSLPNYHFLKELLIYLNGEIVDINLNIYMSDLKTRVFSNNENLSIFSNSTTSILKMFNNDNKNNNELSFRKESLIKIYNTILYIFSLRLMNDYESILKWDNNINNLPIISNAYYYAPYNSDPKYKYIIEKLAIHIFDSGIGSVEKYNVMMEDFTIFHNVSKENYIFENKFDISDFSKMCFRRYHKCFVKEVISKFTKK
jgi:hypothetical protein